MAYWATQLLEWYKFNAREMPWRLAPSFYHIWISEMMLQQTQVVTVIPYFKRFISRFPDVSSLAQADLQDVLKLWEGLGYYSRARNLHKAAKMIEEEFDGVFPKTYKELQRLPGIGPYAAAAIASIAFGQKVPVVDGNVLRVFSRFWGRYDDIRLSSARDFVFKRLMPLIKPHDASSFNQSMMELGALICLPKNPKCMDCPIQSDCYAFINNKVSLFPFKSKLKRVPHYDIAVGLIWADDYLLIGKRPVDKMLGGLWEFPGGKRQNGEPLEVTVKREIKEETDLDVQVHSLFCIVKHAYTHFKITMHVFHCFAFTKKVKALSADELKWISIEELSDFPFPTANRSVVKKLKGFHPVF